MFGSFDPSIWAETLIEFGTQEGNGTLFKKWINQRPCNWMTLAECQNDVIYRHDYNNDDIRYSYVSDAFSDLIDKLSKDGNNDLIKRIVEFLYAFKNGRESYGEDPTSEDCKTFGALYSIFDSIEQTNKTKFDGLDASIKTLSQQNTDLLNQVNYLTKQNDQCETQQQKIIQEKSDLEGQISKLTEQSKALCNELNATQFVVNGANHDCINLI